VGPDELDALPAVAAFSARPVHVLNLPEGLLAAVTGASADVADADDEGAGGYAGAGVRRPPLLWVGADPTPW